MQKMLTYMEDNNVVGIILIGPPGTGKSMIAKAMGNEGSVPTIALDTNGLKGSLVGESEKAMDAALKVITSVTSGQQLWIATCNSISSLPPELRRRFSLGTFFVDLPDEEERNAIWQGYLGKYDVTDDRPDDTGWTGAEIRNCCRNAWAMEISLKEAAEYIVPVSLSAKDQIDRLRKECDGRYLSASQKGVYRMNPDKTTKRQVRVKD
jgi:SpoVK/Ycf46/Vps4 family AAA+-type ATPase